MPEQTIHSSEPSENSPRKKRSRIYAWNMQLDIVTIFIFLICAFFSIITLFTSYRNYKELMELSTIVTDQAAKSVAGMVSDLTNQAQLVAETTRGLIAKEQDVSSKNQTLIAYLLNALIKESNIHEIIIATREGNLVSVTNLGFLNKAHYYLNPSKELPVGSQYALREINRTGPNPSEVWKYQDNNDRIVETEKIPSANYDPRSEKWYIGVSTWPHLRWDVLPSESGNSKVYVSVPIVNAERQVFAVIHVSLALNQISNIFALQTIGKKGRAYILNSSGEILVPSETAAKDIFPSLIKEAYRYSKNHQKRAFVLTDDNVKYLVNITSFPLDFETKWFIAVIVPFDDFFGPVLKIEKETIAISLIILILFTFLVYLASKRISSPIVRLAKEMNQIKNLNFQEPVSIKSNISEIITLNSSLEAMRAAFRSFIRYIPREVVKTLLRQGHEIEIGGERRDLVVLFTDIENFTTIAESLLNEELTSALSEYFSVFTQIIVKCEGTIDKFIGDSVMAFWNAPNLVLDSADKACLAALYCLRMTNKPNEQNILLKAPTRFGIHSGEAIVGNIGTEERMNYTAIGNVVNTASRLQGLNKTYSTSIIISEMIHEKIGTRFITRPLDFILVKGRTKGITIFELVGVREGDPILVPSWEKIILCDEFSKAYERLHAGDFEKAKESLLALHEKFPKDVVTQIYLKRLQRGPI